MKFGSRHSLHHQLSSPKGQKIYLLHTKEKEIKKKKCHSLSIFPSLSLAITPLWLTIKCNCTISIPSAITHRCHIFLHPFPLSPPFSLLLQFLCLCPLVFFLLSPFPVSPFKLSLFSSQQHTHTHIKLFSWLPYVSNFISISSSAFFYPMNP